MKTIPTDNVMGADANDPLAADLCEVTTDRGPETRLWERALAQHDSEMIERRSMSVFTRLRRPLPRRLMAAAAVLVLGVLAVTVMVSSLREEERLTTAASVHKESDINYQSVGHLSDVRGRVNLAASRVPASIPAKGDAFDTDIATPADFGDRLGRLAAPAADAARSVIRKATLELDTPDVRAAFAKAQMVIRPDLGEFIEGSSLNGESKHAIAQITFRFAVSRMDTALNELRTLGTVSSETASGDDVTAQVVDLDARLRNERRVEQEVLALLESRKDAPLKEILDLRDKLAELRQNIEQLQGRKDNLARQVSLATVLLIIRPIDAPPESQLTPIGAYFAQQFRDAWRSGTRTLADALAWLTRLLVGGLPVWFGLSVIVLVFRRLLRRAAANSPEARWSRPAGTPTQPA